MPYPHKYIKLTTEERERIEKEIKRLTLSGKREQGRPLQGLFLSDEQKTYRSIAEHLNVDYRSVKRWCSTYRKYGLDAFIKTRIRHIKP